MKRGIATDLGLNNSYGTLAVRSIQGKYYVELEDWKHIRYREISEELYDMMLKELGDTPTTNPTVTGELYYD